MENFLNSYKTIKTQWITQINQSSQGIFKTVMNQLIYQQHLDSFEPEEFGELSDFTGLQDKLMEINQNEILANFDELIQTLAVFESLLQQLKASIDVLIDEHPNLNSAPKEKLENYIKPIYSAFETEFEMRKGIVEDITSGFHLNSPYDVIVTVTAAWSGKPFTNDRSLAQYEKFIEYEKSAIQVERIKK